MKKLIAILAVLIVSFTSVKIDAEPDTQITKKKAVYQYILDKNIKHPEVVFAQAMLESGNLNSKICKINNNLFGMRLAKSRETVATGKRKGYATYTHWTKSVEDYKLWQDVKPPAPNANYYKYLKMRKYFTDQNYVKALKTVEKRHRFITQG